MNNSKKVLYTMENSIDGKRYGFSSRPNFELNIVRTYGPSLLNRGENGEVKTIKNRTRFSSACLKHAFRKDFHNQFDTTDRRDTERTRYVFEMIADKFENLGLTEEELDKVREYAIKLFTGSDSGVKETKPKDQSEESDEEKISKSLHQITIFEADEVAKFILETDGLLDMIVSVPRKKRSSKKKNNEVQEEETNNWDFSVISGEKIKGANKKVGDMEKALIEKLKNMPVTKEIATFGRFDPSLGRIDSGVRINHSYSLDAFDNDTDFFIANDTLKDSVFANTKCGDAGAGMMGTTDIASNTMYSYMGCDPVTIMQNLAIGRNISNPEVQDSIKKETADICERLIMEMIYLHPEAHQNDMASFPDPHYVYATIGEESGTSSKTFDSLFLSKTYKYKKDENLSVAQQSMDEVIADETQSPFRCRKYSKRSLMFSDTKLSEEQKELLTKNHIVYDENDLDFIQSVVDAIMAIDFVEAP